MHSSSGHGQVRSVRNVKQTVLYSVIGAIFVSLCAVILVMTNRVGSTMGMNIVVVTFSSLGAWVYLKYVIYSRTDFRDGIMRTRGVFSDVEIPLGEVDSVHSDDGLYFLTKSGKRVVFPGFSPSLIGHLRSYKGYSSGFSSIKEAMSGWQRVGYQYSPPGRVKLRLDAGLLAASVGFYVLVLCVSLWY